MKTLIIYSSSSVDNKWHQLEVPDEYVKEKNPIFSYCSDEIHLRLNTKDGVSVTLDVSSHSRVNPSISLSVEFPNKGQRSYYSSERSYIERVGSQNYWAESSYYESDGTQAKYFSVNCQKNNGENTGIQKIWSQYKTPLDGKSWPKGHEHEIPVDMVEQYEASLTQLPRVKETVEYAKNELEKSIPGLIDFLLHDKRFDKLQTLLKTDVPDEVRTLMNSMLYIDSEKDMELCDLATAPSYDNDGGRRNKS